MKIQRAVFHRYSVARWAITPEGTRDNVGPILLETSSELAALQQVNDWNRQGLLSPVLWHYVLEGKA